MRTLFFFASLLTASFCTAQWTKDYAKNTLVSNSITDDIEVSETNDGKNYVVFWDKNPSQNDKISLKLQVIDQKGNLLYGPTGKTINDTAPMGTYTSAMD